MSLNKFVADLKKVPDWKYKKDPSDTSLKEDLSIDTFLTPLDSRETLPLSHKIIILQNGKR